MLFNSGIYIIFLLITVLLYWRLSSRCRIPLLLVASYLFYMSWSPPFGLIYGPLIFLDSLYFYGLSRAMIRWPQWKKRILIFGIGSELCLLGYFKYINFLSGLVDQVMASLHMPAFHMEFQVFLPLAISFTNFILISYLVDVYRGDEKPDSSFVRFATYVAFFPHLIAGPIVRAKELLHQFDSNPKFSTGMLAQGLHKYLAGFAVKVLVADVMADYVIQVYGNPELQNFASSWVATYAFAIQIFGDFLGYTLMAQGSALLLGYTLPENFNAPYFAQNITDFWRRWHMSLSRWLRDYLYIPLGGSRCSRLRTYCNLFITMGLGGLWHGANWTFVIWGLYHGLLLSLHKLGIYLKITRFVPQAIALLLTFHAVCVGWVFFRAASLAEALHILSVMFNPLGAMELSSRGQFTLLFAGLFLAGHWLVRLLSKQSPPFWVVASAQGVAYFVLLLTILAWRSPSQEFIYFQF